MQEQSTPRTTDFTKWRLVALIADGTVRRLVENDYTWRPWTIDSATTAVQEMYNRPSDIWHGHIWHGHIADDELPIVRRLIVRSMVEQGVTA